jgi:hypothetical protein
VREAHRERVLRGPELELLGDTPRVGGADYFTRCSRDDAIIERRPYLLYVRNRETTGSVYTYRSATPLEAAAVSAAVAGWISGETVTFERVCDDVRKAAAAWPTELRILRDEPDQLLLHFLRAPLPARPAATD